MADGWHKINYRKAVATRQHMDGTKQAVIEYKNGKWVGTYDGLYDMGLKVEGEAMSCPPNEALNEAMKQADAWMIENGV